MADWTKYAWDAVEEELQAIFESAAEHSIWVVVGCLTRQPHPGQSPFNSLIVIDDHGTTVGRYDKRHLSASGSC